MLEGASGDYAATLLGSFVTITDGDTCVSIPVGLAGLMVDFSDVGLELRVEGGQVMLGEDVVPAGSLALALHGFEASAASVEIDSFHFG